MTYRTLNLLGGILFAILSGVGFYYLWSTVEPDPSLVSVSMDLQSVEIESVKGSAQKLIFDLENQGSIPIPAPVDKLNNEDRKNPFQGI